MRPLFLVLSAMLLIGACTASTPKIQKKPVKSRYISVDGQYMAGGVRCFKENDIVRLWNKRVFYKSPGIYVKDFAKEFNLLYKKYKTKNSYVLQSRLFDDPGLNYKGKKFSFTDFAYNANKNQYILSGINFYGTNKHNLYNKKFPCIVVFDAQSKEFQRLYHGPEDSVVRLDDKHGSVAAFSKGNNVTIINFNSEKAVNLSPAKYPFPKFPDFMISSSGGKYVALKSQGKEENALRIGLYDSESGKLLKNFDFRSDEISGYRSLACNFSKDEQYFIFKGPDKKFQIYDIVNQKVTDTFGENKSWAATASVVTVDDLIIAGFVGKYNNSYEKESYFYDIDTCTVLCKPELFFKENDLYWKSENLLHSVYSYNSHRSYNLGENDCFKISDEFIDLKRSPKADNMTPYLAFIKDDIYYTFEDGKVISQLEFNKVDIDSATVEIVKSLERVKRLFSVGFDKKGFSELNKLLQKDLNYFEKYYKEVSNTLDGTNKYSKEAYFNALAMKEYIRQGKTKNNKEFERAAQNYAYFAVILNFKEALPSFIKTYEDAIGKSPGAIQNDMLALYKAMYLFEINKDEKAYELLFDANPIEPGVIRKVIRMSALDFGLFKNRKKLAVAMGIDADDFKKSQGEFYDGITATCFYDLNGNKIKR
jgi:hypothetical protein